MENPLELRRGSLYCILNDPDIGLGMYLITSRIKKPGAFQYQDLYDMQNFIKTFTFTSGKLYKGIEILA